MKNNNKGWKNKKSLQRIVIANLMLAFCFVTGMFTISATTIYEGAQAQKDGIAYNDRLSTYVVGENSSDYAQEFNNYKTYIIVHDGVNETRAMNLKKGGLHVTLYGLYASTGGVSFFADEACTQEVGKISITANSETTGSAQNSYVKTGTIIIPSTGIYYVQFTNSTGNIGYYQMSTQQYDGRNRRITDTKTMSFIDSTNGPIYYMVDVKKDGYITLEPEFCNNAYGAVQGNVELTLTDANKKAISKKAMIGNAKADARKAVYAVKAGTYYIKAASEDQRLFSMSCTQTAVKEKSGADKKNAQIIKNKTWYSGIATYEDKTTKGDYYKFTLTKASKVVFQLKGNVTSGSLLGEISGDNVNGSFQGITLNTVGQKATKWNVNTKSSKTLPAGTYYIKISKDTKKTNGNYKLKIVAK